MSVVTCSPLLEGGATSTLAQWSVGGERKDAVLAVAVEDSPTTAEVLLFTVEGVRVHVTPRLHRSSGVALLVWKAPSSERKGLTTLFVGWLDGALQRIDMAESVSVKQEVDVVERRSVDGDHEVHIVAGECCPDGRSLVTATSEGSLTMWDVDEPAGKLEILHRVSSRVGVPKHIVFRTNDPSSPNRPPYVFAADSGRVCSVTSVGTQVECYKVVGSINYLSFMEADDRVVILSSNGILARFKLDTAGKVIEDAKMKLSSANPSETRCCWAGAGLLVTVSREAFVRLWRLRSGGKEGKAEQAHYLMALQDGSEKGSRLNKDVAVSIAFDPSRMVIACGTARGHIVRWRCLVEDAGHATDADWEPLPLIEVPGGNSIERLFSCYQKEDIAFAVGVSGSTGSPLLSQWIVSDSGVRWSSCLAKVAVQTSAHQLALIDTDNGTRSEVECGDEGEERVHLKGVVLLKAFLVCWSRDTVFIFTTTASVEKGTHATRISAPSMVTATAWCYDPSGDAKKPTLADLTLVIAYQRRIAFLNGNGAQKKEVPYLESSDGSPRALACSPSGLVIVVSSTSIIRVWDLGRGAAMAAAGAAPKALGAPRSINNIGEGQVVESVAANCNGSRVSLLVSRPVKTADGVPRRQIDSRVIFYDIVNDILSSKDCKASDILYTPVSHMWDQRDPRVMACEGRDVSRRKAAARDDVSSGSVGCNTLLIFILDDSGSGRIVVQGTHPCQRTLDSRAVVGVLPVALVTPYIYFYDQVDGEITKVCQRSFSGMEAACDGPQGESTAKALIDFSFYLAKGNADAAYRAVRAVDSLAVWENLCRMAVKTRQLQVARRCLGRIQASGGGVHGVVTGIPAAALRASFVLREAEAKGDFATDEEELAAIAVHLGMIEEAEEHYKEAPEYSKLNKLYQKLGRWSDSIAVAEVHDRMHLPSTHFACAKSLEARGDVDGALKKYEEAGSAGLSEIPRMFLRFGLFQQLREYIDRAEKPCLYKWYGQYLESMGNAEEAEQYYRKAEDWATLVRLSWVKSDLDGARRICRESGDSDATYQHAKYLQQYCTASGGVEGKEELLKEAVESYSVAGRVGAALRLAQSYDMEAELIKLSMQAVYSDEGAGGTATAGAMQAARFYESKGNYARAAALYQKIGQTDKAISLCLATRQYDALRKLADDLTLEITDTATVEKCVKVLIEREYYDKAVQILANTDQLEKAVGMCEDYNVSLTEELAEKLTPKDRDHPRYKDLLLAIGEMAKKQGLYAVACKKFTQAGDKIAAMKALLRSGDTEKIIFYAQTARTKEVFVLAANNLQSLDWYNNPEVEKNIIAFYTRAKAAEMLARFHEARAHRAIDEHQDVDAAIAALEEAVTVVERDPGASYKHLSPALNASLQVLRKFAEARRSASTDPRASLVACGGLLQSSELTQSPLRPGDVYAFMAHLFDHNGQTSDAAEVVKRMIQENITPSVYIPRQLLQRIGFGGLPKEASDEQAEGEVIEEEIVEDITIS